MTENVKENTPIIRVKELEKYFLAKRGYINMLRLLTEFHSMLWKAKQ